MRTDILAVTDLNGSTGNNATRRGPVFARLAAVTALLAVAGCAAPQNAEPVRAATGVTAVTAVTLDPRIASELDQAAARQPRIPDAAEVQNALLPPLRAEMPRLGARGLEPRFDIAIRDATAAQAFSSIVAGSRYSMLLHPEVAGRITLSLKDTTVREALDALRELYGYEYRIEGTRVFVQPAGMQTRLFRVNYPAGQRQGESDLRVSSTASGEGTALSVSDASRVQSSVTSDFWRDLRNTLSEIVGSQAGRSVVVNPQASLVVVKAMPGELRDVELYLKEVRLSVERQVMLEAKIVEVTLAERYQAGIDWSRFPAAARSGGTLIPGVPGGTLLGFASRTPDFNAVMAFLESQGTLQVLSSPRLATLNNQKAVLKVGTDALYVTQVTGGATGAGHAQAGFPGVSLRSYFSGVALDVMPQIDQDSVVILHVHPSVSEVAPDDKTFQLGRELGTVSLPAARSTVSETDSVVRVRNGDIVAIGGLMKLETRDRSGIASAQRNAPSPAGADSASAVKKELVILIKPTVIQSDRDWIDGAVETRDRLVSPTRYNDRGEAAPVR